MKKVGSHLEQDPKKYFTYPMVAYDENGFADATLFHPIDYDLLTLRLHGKEDPIKGWCCGNSWDGFKMQDSDIVTHWKKGKQEEET